MQNFVPYCIKIRVIVVITNHYAILDYTIKFYIDWTSKNMSDSLLSDQNWWFYSLFLILGVRRCQGTNLELIWIAIKGDVNTLKMNGTYVNQYVNDSIDIDIDLLLNINSEESQNGSDIHTNGKISNFCTNTSWTKNSL